MADTAQRAQTIRRMALLCAGLMVLTIVLSAFMRLSQAGLGCADWPACYGQALQAEAPAGHAVAAARLLHRVVASVALIVVVMLVLASLATRPPLRREGALAAALLVLAIGLALLGIVTPGARVPAVTMGNLMGGFAMLALCWRLADPAGGAARATGLRRWALAGLALSTLQVALGALVSGAFAALACDGLADCSRSAAAAGWDWRALDPWRVPAVAQNSADRAGALVQWAHRAGAVVLMPVLAGVGLLAWRHGHRVAGTAVLLLIAAQGGLGLLMVAAGLPIALVLAHNLCAAMLIALLARLA